MTQKINYIKINDWKWIKEIEAKDLSRFVAVFWKNWAWKTSFIEAIKNAIKLEKGWNKKVRIWEENGEIIVEFDDFKIKRIVWDNWKLEVEHNGELVKRPQERLDNIFMWVLGDPQKFISLHNKEKIRYLLETQWKKDEYDILEKKRNKWYLERQDKHRTLLAKKEEIDKTIIKEIPLEEQSESMENLQKEISDIDEHNKLYYDLKERLAKEKNIIEEIDRSVWSVTSSIDYKEKHIEKLKREIEQTERIITEKREEAKLLIEKSDKAEKIKSEIDLELESFQLKDKNLVMEKINWLNVLQKRNAEINAKKDLLKYQENKRDELEVERRELDENVKIVETEQNNLIEWLKLWYKFKLENWVMSVLIEKNRIPLDELNKALQIEIWVEICLNWPNEIKIITIEDANALDPKTLENIKKKIEKKNAQCFLEVVYAVEHDMIEIYNWEIKK